MGHYFLPSRPEKSQITRCVDAPDLGYNGRETLLIVPTSVDAHTALSVSRKSSRVSQPEHRGGTWLLSVHPYAPAGACELGTGSRAGLGLPILEPIDSHTSGKRVSLLYTCLPHPVRPSCLTLTHASGRHVSLLFTSTPGSAIMVRAL